MLAYVGVYFWLAVTALAAQERAQRGWVIFFAIFLLWYMGARDTVGCDWWGYLHRFNVVPLNQPFTAILSDFDEPGFWLLMKFVRENGLHYLWLNFIATVIMLICFVVFCRAHRNSLVILALMFPVIIVQLGMSGIRQGIAVGFVLVATVAWMRGSKSWTAIWIIAGSLFHTSVLMFLPLVPMAGRKVTTTWLFGATALLSPLVVFLMGDRVETYSDRYLDNSDITSNGALLRYILLLIPAVFYWKYKDKLKVAFPESFELMRLTTALTFSLIPVAIFSSILLHRVIYYIMPLSILTFVALAHVAFPKMGRKSVLFLPIAVYGLYSVAWFLFSYHANVCYIPYQNFWSPF